MTNVTTATARSTTLNGLDLAQMNGTVALLQTQPALARFEFRAANRWVTGGENRSRIQGFFGAGAEDTSRATAWEFVNGEPPVLLGHNEGANPVEFLLHALAGCVTTTTVLHAAARGIEIRRLSTELEGDLDLQGFLGLDPNVAAGYQGIRIRMHVEAECSDEELDDLLAFVRDHSPVCSTIRHPVPVAIERSAD
jgi:uncharacterized OsmC-like protein